jgi:adenine-specific DNA-methyltransferase
MNKRTKLELTWIGKENLPRLEPRILLENPSKSYHARTRITDHDIFDNILIRGDNLLALKALQQKFAGEVKCVYIDPPFNTQQAFEHYDDGVAHSTWLTMIRDRIAEIYELLAPSGTIWLHLDDSEVHRARCILDEIFGPENFLGTVIWEKSDSPRNDAEFFSSRHDYLIVYAKVRASVTFNKVINDSGELPEHYDKVDDAGRPYYLKPLRAMGGQGDSRAARPNLYFPLTSPDGTEIYPKRQDGSDGAWRWSEEKVRSEKERIEWISGRNGWTPNYRVYGDAKAGRPPETIWPHSEVGSNRTSKGEVKALLPDLIPFSTPKPERLLRRVLTVATNPDDLVLDSFAGSGTTGAVAHKMHRRWIMAEFGEHCDTHVVPRLRQVIDGSDNGGITKVVGWGGGGGFRYYEIASSLLQKDRFGNWIISSQYNAAMLAEAMCKLEGFTYSPSETEYWMHGRSTERDFIYVTTQTLTREQLQKLSDEVGDNRSLLVCCSAFRVKDLTQFPNLTVKKIPKMVLNRCEWGRDDYSLEVRDLPSHPPDAAESENRRNGKKRNGNGSLDLFATISEKGDSGK